MVRIDVADAGRAKDLVRVLVTHVGAEPVSLDPHTGAVWVAQHNDEGLALTLGALDAWMRGCGRRGDQLRRQGKHLHDEGSRGVIPNCACR